MRTSQIAVTTDAVIFRKLSTIPELVLVRRKNEPYKNCWALPGGFVEQHEDLKDAAVRELFEETGLQISALEQVQAFGKPHRDPRGHTVSIAFMGIANDDAAVNGADDAEEAQWFPLSDLPELAFDHAEIISVTRQKFNL